MDTLHDYKTWCLNTQFGLPIKVKAFKTSLPPVLLQDSSGQR